MKKHEQELIDLYKKLEAQIEAAIDSGKNNRSSMFHKQLIVKIDNIFKEHDVKVDEWTKSSVESIYNDSTKAQKRNLKKSTEKSDDKESSKMSQEEKDKLDKDSIDEIAKGKTSQLRYANSSLQKNIKNSIKKNAKEKGRRQKEIADSLKEDIYSKDGDGRISIKCKDGKVRNYDPEKYAQVVAQQAEIEAKSTAAENEAKKMDTQIMAMSSHSPTCKICATLQGRWYSLDKKNKDFPYIYDTAWKNGKVIHPGCRHTFKAVDLDGVDEKTLAEKKELSNRAFELSDEDEKMLKMYYDDQKKKAKVARDTNSYNELVNTIGKDNLPSLEEFVKIKEEGGEEWDRIKELERQAEGEKLEAGSEGVDKYKFTKYVEYSDGIRELAKKGLKEGKSKKEILEEIHKSYYSSKDSIKGLTVISDTIFLKDDGFDQNGRTIVDWPQKMGFEPSTVEPITSSNLPTKWDRVGTLYGENFTTIPEDDVPYSYDERAIPYIENPSARMTGTFDKQNYFKVIDAISENDLEKLNQIVSSKGKEIVSPLKFKLLKSDYEKFQLKAKNEIGEVDAKYGLYGHAAEWKNSENITLLNGGAEQIVTPLKGVVLNSLGILRTD